MSGPTEDDSESLMRREVAAFVNRGLSQEEAEAIVGVQGVSIDKRGHRMEWLPTPAEIAELTAAIRAAWHDSEYPTRRQQMLDGE